MPLRRAADFSREITWNIACGAGFVVFVVVLRA